MYFSAPSIVTDNGGYHYGHETGLYYRYSSDQKKRDEAARFCAQSGGRLAMPKVMPLPPTLAYQAPRVIKGYRDPTGALKIAAILQYSLWTL